jgi:phosphotriesterase-related protein
LKTVNTVRGPLATDSLGTTLMHEHLQTSFAGFSQIYPELLGKEYLSRPIRELTAAKAGGIDTVVDCTTMELGRDIRVLAEISEKSGVNVIASTGWWLDNVLPMPLVPNFLGTFTADQFAEVFAREILVGIEGTGIKAGIIKSAADFEGVKPVGATMLRGVARAHLKTGAPIMLHSFAPSQVARQQLAILREEGVDLRRVKVDHVIETTDIEYLTWIVEQGCYLGMDRMPGVYPIPSVGPSQKARMNTIKAMIDAGYADRLLFSHDEVTVTPMFDTLSKADQEKIERENPHSFLYISKVVLPGLVEMGVPEEVVATLLTDNPRRFFEGPQD